MKNNWKPLSVLACSLFVAACGGGGGGSSDGPGAPQAAPGNPASGPTAPSSPVSTTTVTGAVTKGPVSGSVVGLFEIDEFGNALGSAVATGTTDDDGGFTITVPDGAGDLLVVARGGSFIDESDQQPDITLKRRIELGATDSFLSFLPSGQTEVAITPFTTALVIRARMLGGPDGTFDTRFAESKAAFNAQVGFDVLETIPANPVAPATDATEQQKQYALLLGGIANLINNVAIQSGASAPNYNLVVAVTFDLIDGQFDGLYFGDTNVPGSMADPVQLPQNLNFEAEVNRFKNNNFANFESTTAPILQIASFANGLPTANAGTDGIVRTTNVATLDGSLSNDPDSGLFYSWVQTEGTTVTLSDDTAVAPSFTAPQLLVGKETLTFELTVIDTLGFTATDTVAVEVVGALPTDFYVVDSGEIGDGVGIDIDGGGRITLNDATTGVLLADEPVAFTYTVLGNVLTLNFATPYLQDDFDEERDTNGDGEPDTFFLIEEQVDRYEFTLVTDNPNGDALTIRSVGNIVTFRIEVDVNGDFDEAATRAGGGSIPDEPIDETDPIVAFDIAQATPFAFAPGDRRTLLFNSFNKIPTLQSDDELYPEIFTFINGDSGSTLDSNESFTYTIAADGSLDVSFANGDTAKYINLTTRPSGDVVATEYNLAVPFFPGDSAFISDVSTSFVENTAAVEPTTRLQAAGVYSGLVSDDEIEAGSRINLRLNPDGTGSLTFDSIASRFFLYDFDDVIVFRSNFGVCWDVETDGDLRIKRARSTNVSFPDSFSAETDPTFCAGLIEDDTDFEFLLTQFDSDGVSYKHFGRRRTNACAFIDTAECFEAPELFLSDFDLRNTTRVPFTATPPVAALDRAQVPDSAPVEIDILANDIARDQPIDPTSVQLVGPPIRGTAVINPTTGAVTYALDAGESIGIFQYTVSDTLGNRSQVQTVEITNNPCPSINGVQAFFDSFNGDCDFSGLTGLANVVTTDLDLGPLPDGGVYIFDDFLVIGEDFNTDAGLAAAGITQGGDGPSLNIAAGTVMAFAGSENVIAINRGSQINVAGAPSDPVIFTSLLDIQSQREIERGGPGFQRYNDSGQWGGVVIHGFGVINDCQYSGSVMGGDLALIGECHNPTPSGTGHFGGDNNLDSSGSIDYLQIRYSGGILFSANDEAGALALGSVGSGTSIQNVQVYSTFGDSFQLVGGDVDLQNVISLYAGISGVLVDSGYLGNVRNALLIQDRLSGESCVEASGYDGAVNPVAAEALITQGINSRPVFSNLTCVVSAADGQPFQGQGFDFADGVFATLADSIAVVPGQDSFAPNFCFSVEDRSLQAAQDFDLSATSNLFACPDNTSFEPLPNSTPLESFLTSTGNQFASISPGTVNLPPAVGAGTGNELLEGSPLIFAPTQVNLVIDGSPVSVSPVDTFIGAVQQGPGDWTQDWTFGLYPDSQIQGLWYEAPIVVTPNFVPASKGELVTLDASQSIGLGGGLTFQWNEGFDSVPVILSDVSGATTSFTAPGAGTNLTVEGGVVNLELIVTDAAGLETIEQVTIPVDASLPLEFFTTSESIIPLAFGTFIERGARVNLNSDNTGFFSDSAAGGTFNWVDSTTDFTLNFPTGKFGLPVASQEDTDGDPMILEDVTRTKRIDQMIYTLVSDIGPKKVYTLSQSGAVEVFDVTNGVPLPDEPFNDNILTSNEAIVGLDRVLPIEFFDGEVRSLLANVANNVPTLTNPDFLILDELSFGIDGEGFALNKNTGFVYSVDEFGKLVVNFDDGEVGEYFQLFDNEGGQTFGVTYTKADTSVVSQVASSLSDDPNISASSPIPFMPGIFTAVGREQLDDGTAVERRLFYRLHPEGTGQLELETYDPITGLLTDFFVSSTGICWELDGDDNLIFSRTNAGDQRFMGSRVPSLSHCQLINTASPDNTLITRQRINKIFNFGSMLELQSFALNFENQCNDGAMGCDPNVLDFTSTFQRNFESVTAFLGNPPLAAPDSFTSPQGSPDTFDVLLNDVDGDSAIDPTQVTILVQPTKGTATVDSVSGMINYQSDGAASGNDVIYYRVKDVNGNDSTIGRVDIFVDDGMT